MYMNKNALGVGAAVIVALAGAYWVFANKPGIAPADTTTTAASQAPVTSGENPQPGSIHDLPVEPAAAAARRDLAAKLGVGEKSITIMQITDATWSDGCLGLGGPAESCLRAQTPGFRVEMLAQGNTYIYRTDK